MKRHYSCGSEEHTIHRRALLESAAAASALGLGGFLTGTRAVAEQVKSSRRQVLNVFLHGGVSQLETWDPKPDTDTGGPFRTIATSVPGIHICELLPHTAKQMHRLSIVRSLDTKNNNHGRGVVEMTTGHKQMAGTEYPHLGAVASKALTPDEFTLPGHILVRQSAGKRNVESEFHKAAYLGPRFASMAIYDAKPPIVAGGEDPTLAQAGARRNFFRKRINDRFSRRRRSADTDAYNFSFEQARELVSRREVFDVTREPKSDQERYGKSPFGTHCLLARRLLEQGVPYVQVNHADYDTHHENFNFHIEQLGEFDQPFAMLVEDLAERGMLDNVLICVMSEFGRTPKINTRYGRDHWGTAWSVAMGGAGIQPGGVVGKTNKNGTQVVERSVDHGHIFHTILQAAGVDSSGHFEVGGRRFPIADPAKSGISELMA